MDQGKISKEVNMVLVLTLRIRVMPFSILKIVQMGQLKWPVAPDVLKI